MATINPPLYLQGGIYPASVDATGIAASFVHDDVAQHVRSGVVFNNLGNLRVTAAGAPSVAIGDGRAVIDTEEGGAYLCTNRGSTTIAIPAGGASPRRDIIGVQVLDAENGDAGNVWVLTRIQGAPQPVPVDPNLPSQYFTPLARVRVGAGVSAINQSMIDDLRVFTSAAGGVIVCDSAHKPAVSRVPYGQVIFETDTLALRVYNGTAWTQIVTDGVTAKDGSTVGFYVKGFSGQTANLQEWRSDTNTVLSRVAFNGAMYIGANQVATLADVGGGSVSYAANAGLLDGIDSTGFAGAGHGHDPSGYSVNYANSAGSAGSAGVAAAVSNGPGLSISTSGITCTALDTAGGTQTWLRINSSGNFFTSAAPSSLRFKKEIQPLEDIDVDALLGLQPQTFIYDSSLPNIDVSQEEEGRQPGLIAEEVDEAGLHDLVIYNPDGEPTSLRYDQIAVMLLPIIRELREKVATLEARLAD